MYDGRHVLGAHGVQYVVKIFCSCYAVAKYILEANIEAKSGWPLAKPNPNYPLLSTVLRVEGYNYNSYDGHSTNPPVLSSGLPVKY